MKSFINRDDVVKIINRTATNAKVPTMMTKWWGLGLADALGDDLVDLDRQFDDDIFVVYYREPGKEFSTNDNPEYRFGYKDYSSQTSHGTADLYELIPDWAELDEFFEKFPNPNEPETFDHIKPLVAEQKARGRYCVGMWWYFFHERFWVLRGMENLMIDYYDEMDNLKKLGKKLVEFYKVIIDRYAEIGVDAIFTSDDLGHQTGPMMSPEIFKELYLPLYKEVIEHVHKRGLHFILHSCGDNTLLMPYLIEAGVDVLHPIQTGCMSLEKTIEEYGDKISFLVGVDVQHLLPEGTPESVECGIENMINICYKPNGGLLVAAGNGIMPGTPIENILSLLKTLEKHK